MIGLLPVSNVEDADNRLIAEGSADDCAQTPAAASAERRLHPVCETP